MGCWDGGGGGGREVEYFKCTHIVVYLIFKVKKGQKIVCLTVFELPNPK